MTELTISSLPIGSLKPYDRTQPPDLTLQQILSRINLALDWPTQRRQLGFEL